MTVLHIVGGSIHIYWFVSVYTAVWNCICMHSYQCLDNDRWMQE